MATVIGERPDPIGSPASPDPREPTRARIIETALELISEQGFAATSTREISERLGFTKAALYYHFRTKDDLLVAIIEPAMGELAAPVADAEAESPLSPAAKRRVLDRYLDHLLGCAEIIGVRVDDPGVRRSAPTEAALLLFDRLVEALAGSITHAKQRLRAWAAFGALHAGVRHARSEDGCGAVREAVLAAACGALGVRGNRRAGGANSWGVGTTGAG